MKVVDSGHVAASKGNDASLLGRPGESAVTRPSTFDRMLTHRGVGWRPTGRHPVRRVRARLRKEE